MRIFNRTVQNACSTAVGHYADSQEASQTFEKKKKKKPAVLRRACPQYGGGGSFTITISNIRHTEYSFIFFLIALYSILLCEEATREHANLKVSWLCCDMIHIW